VAVTTLACQSKMLNFSTRGLHVQTMLEYSICTVYKDDVSLNLEVRYLWVKPCLILDLPRFIEPPVNCSRFATQLIDGDN
jgi:hypothetical protein